MNYLFCEVRITAPSLIMLDELISQLKRSPSGVFGALICPADDTDTTPPRKVFEHLTRLGFQVQCYYQTLRVCYGLWEEKREASGPFYAAACKLFFLAS